MELERHQVVALTLVRDGALWLQSYIDHHLNLGVHHIVLLDNGSTDGTVAIARQYAKVTVLRSMLPFRTFKREMRLYLLRRFARDRWSLNLDVDELFDYPHSSRVSLPALIAHLDRRRKTAMVTYLLDFFADGPLGRFAARPEDQLLELYPYYDLSCVRATRYRDARAFQSNRFEDPDLRCYGGGIRRHLFGADVNLTKHSLFFSGKGVVPGPTHRVERAQIADTTGVLYHFKFLSNLAELAARAARERSYYRESEAYRAVLRELAERPILAARSSSSERFEGVDRLVERGFLKAGSDLCACDEEVGMSPRF